MNYEAMKRMLLAVAGVQELDQVLDQIVEGIANCRNVALARIWLLRPGQNPGDRPHLALAASAGNLAQAGTNAKKLDGHFSRFELGERKIGRVASQAEGVLIADVAQNDEWIAYPAWALAEGIQSFAAQPLIARSETLGVLGVFDRAEILQEDFEWFRTFADHAAVAIWNANAFDEINDLKRQLERDNAYLREEVATASGAILGNSPAMATVKQQIAMVAPTAAGVLIHGESGVGKELVARAIHEQSRRAQRPLVKVNCASIPGELFESEFFGHLKGAFTGANRDRVGRFELAHGGTLFLDEVGEIPLAHQAKLLRVLQEGSFEAVGDEVTRQTDVRIIAATNRNLAIEVAAGRFRSDLYYRLGVFPIEVPPLRARDHDLPILIEHFLEQAGRRLGLPVPRITSRELKRLEAYDWPGNIRELQHVVERAVILSRGKSLVFEDLKPATAAPPQQAPLRSSTELPSLVELKQIEREILAAALTAADGKVSGKNGAAQALGIPPSTLESKLRSHGLKS